MIFNVPGHIDMIRNGLHYVVLRQHDPKLIIKTQTRRLNRGIYHIELKRTKPHKIGYAVQSKRGAKVEQGIRIVIDKIWEETTAEFHREDSTVYPIPISKEDAWAEGGYGSFEYEQEFKKTYPKWNGFSRWAFQFHTIEVV